MMVLCPRAECPIERRRRAVNAYIQGRPFKSQCAQEIVELCTFCRELKGWKIDHKGNEREIPKHILLGESVE